MNIRYTITNEGVNFQDVADLLRHFGLCDYDSETEKAIFARSYAVAYAWDGDRLIGCGRALSDGIAQAAIYNVAVAEGYHGHELGRHIIEKLVEQVPGCVVILFTHPQTVRFYERIGFRRQKTGLVLYQSSEEDVKWHEDMGFLLPKEYRFPKDEISLYPDPGPSKEYDGED